MYSVFKYKTINPSKLMSFGFQKQDCQYVYKTYILNNQFCLHIYIKDTNNIKTKLIDVDTNEEYIQHLIPNNTGSFIGKINASCQNILQEIADKCFDNTVFKSNEAALITEYIKNKYNDELEFLWDKFPDNAIARRCDNKKWYLVILTVSRRKLGADSDDIIEILDLRLLPEQLDTLIDNKKYFAGYHMNKKHWYTICLDGSINIEEIYKRIDESYMLANKGAHR